MLQIKSSRITQGNFLFPLQLVLYDDRVVVSKQRFFGSSERTIPIGKVASVTARKGIFFASMRIESSGGSDDIVASGFLLQDVMTFRDALQSKLSAAVAPVVQPNFPAGSVTAAQKTCKFCAETIQAAAIKCRYCGEMLDYQLASTSET